MTDSSKKSKESEASESEKYNLFRKKEQNVLHDDKDALTELIEILNSENVEKWNKNCELLYKEYNLEEIKECKMGYESIQYKLYRACLDEYVY